jgi:hypothetical protein
MIARLVVIPILWTDGGIVDIKIVVGLGGVPLPLPASNCCLRLISHSIGLEDLLKSRVSGYS